MRGVDDVISLQFCNSAEADRCELINAAVVGADGWAQLAPFGDFPGLVTTVLPGGGVKGKPVPATQRMDRAAAEAMVENFNRPWSRVVRWLRGLPIYSGHPDFPGAGNRYPDKTPKGQIAALQVRNDGLYALPVFNAEGQSLIESQPGLGFSARWLAIPVGESDGVTILRPTELISAGLTTSPNLPVQLINEAPTMDHKALIAALKRIGVIVADDADLAAITTAVGTAADKMDADKAAASTQAANDRNALATAQTELANARTALVTERTAHATSLINEAIRTGRATEADRSTLTAQFANDFTVAATALAARAATALKTKGTVIAATLPAQTGTIAQRQATVHQLINERTAKGATYDEAFIAIQAERPELFSGAKA